MRTMKDSIRLTIGIALLTGAGATAQQSYEAFDAVGGSQTVDSSRIQQRRQIVQNDDRSPNGVIILNNNQNDVKSSGTSAATSSSRVRANSQPTTYVEASPLVESRANNLRKARENAEVSTEQRIVEKLEESRLDDEKRRADRLFGNRLEETEVKNVQKEEVRQVVVTPPPVQPVAPPPQPSQQVIVVQPSIQRNEEFVRPLPPVKEEVRGQAEDLDHLHRPPTITRWYVGGLLGTSEYLNTSNVQGNFAGGFTVGQIYSTGLVLEGGFLYSNYYLTNYARYFPYQNLDQYGLSFAAKYQFLRTHSWLHPFVGGVAQYTYRNYTSRVGTSYYLPDASVNSSAFDLGASFGADAVLTNEFSIGVDVRYLFNVFARSSGNFIGNSEIYSDGSKPLEKQGNWTFLLTGKYIFD